MSFVAVKGKVWASEFPINYILYIPTRFSGWKVAGNKKTGERGGVGGCGERGVLPKTCARRGGGVRREGAEPCPRGREGTGTAPGPREWPSSRALFPSTAPFRHPTSVTPKTSPQCPPSASPPPPCTRTPPPQLCRPLPTLRGLPLPSPGGVGSVLGVLAAAPGTGGAGAEVGGDKPGGLQGG